MSSLKHWLTTIALAISLSLPMVASAQTPNSSALHTFIEKHPYLKNNSKILALLKQGETEAIENGMKAKDFYKYLKFAYSKLTNRTHKKLTKYTPTFLSEFESAYIWNNSIEFWWLTEYFKEKQDTLNKQEEVASKQEDIVIAKQKTFIKQKEVENAERITKIITSL